MPSIVLFFFKLVFSGTWTNVVSYFIIQLQPINIPDQFPKTDHQTWLFSSSRSPYHQIMWFPEPFFPGKPPGYAFLLDVYHKKTNQTRLNNFHLADHQATTILEPGRPADHFHLANHQRSFGHLVDQRTTHFQHLGDHHTRPIHLVDNQTRHHLQLFTGHPVWSFRSVLFLVGWFTEVDF